MLVTLSKSSLIYGDWRVAVAQVNPVLGDLRGNGVMLIEAAKKAQEQLPTLTIFPAMVLTSCPLGDLATRPNFMQLYRQTLNEVVAQLPGLVIFGGNDYSAIVAHNGKIVAKYRRHFMDDGLTIQIGEFKFGVIVGDEVLSAQKYFATGVQGIICLDAEPFSRYQPIHRALKKVCRENNSYFLHSNLCGAQDELLFAGDSAIIAPDGNIIAQAKFAEPDIIVGQPQENTVTMPSINANENEKIYTALTISLRDYVRKNNFKRVVLGLSGGIDSALVAAIAVDALGAENVIGVTMPSVFSSSETQNDARKLAENLTIKLLTLPIEKPLSAFNEMLAPMMEIAPITDHEKLMAQNLQARIRTVYLMALANRYGWLLLNTSNKSEFLVGYGTLYGDMAGGFAAIKDIYKTEVWNLARYVNAKCGREIIPLTTIERVPSAELRADQEDRQTLPDYPRLDPILKLFYDERKNADEIIALGNNADDVKKIIALIDRHEFKRRQSVIGLALTPANKLSLPITTRFLPSC